MPDEKRMVIIPLMGGLGNQLFQFAAGLYTKKFSNKASESVYSDESSLPPMP